MVPVPKQIGKTRNLTFLMLYSWHPGLCLQIYLPPFPSTDFVGHLTFSFPPQTILVIGFKVFCALFFLCVLLQELIVSRTPLPCNLEHSKTQGRAEGGEFEILFVNRLQRKDTQVRSSPQRCFLFSYTGIVCMSWDQSKFRVSTIFPKRFQSSSLPTFS